MGRRETSGPFLPRCPSLTTGSQGSFIKVRPADLLDAWSVACILEQALANEVTELGAELVLGKRRSALFSKGGLTNKSQISLGFMFICTA